MEYINSVAEEEVAPEDLVEEISIPGVPEGADRGDHEGWTAGTVREGIEELSPRPPTKILRIYWRPPRTRPGETSSARSRPLSE